MLRKLVLGFFLRCPNCEKGAISGGLFHIHPTCPECGVRYERKAGESTGASMIFLSLLPFFSLLIFFAMYFTNPELPLVVLAGVPLAFILITAPLLYRNMRGLWIAVIYLQGGVHKDPES